MEYRVTFKWPYLQTEAIAYNPPALLLKCSINMKIDGWIEMQLTFKK